MRCGIDDKYRKKVVDTVLNLFQKYVSTEVP